MVKVMRRKEVLDEVDDFAVHIYFVLRQSRAIFMGPATVDKYRFGA